MAVIASSSLRVFEGGHGRIRHMASDDLVDGRIGSNSRMFERAQSRGAKSNCRPDRNAEKSNNNSILQRPRVCLTVAYSFVRLLGRDYDKSMVPVADANGIVRLG